MNLCISGNEDKEIKFFDLWSNEMIDSYVGHTDSVSALALINNGLTLISGAHDGSVWCWDIRKRQCVSDLNAHWKKYDEGVRCLASIP